LAGSNGEIQFNNNGNLGSSSNLYWDNATNHLHVNGTINADVYYDIIIASDGTGDYTDINLAISTEDTNTTFFIKNGTYTLTSNLVMKTGQSLLGESIFNTIIDCDGNSGYYINVNTNCTLSTFSVVNHRDGSGSIYASGKSNVLIKEIFCDSQTVGIESGLYTSGVYVSGNDITLQDIKIKNYYYNYRIENCSRVKANNLSSEDSHIQGFRMRGLTFSMINNLVSVNDNYAVYFRDSDNNLISNVVVQSGTNGIFFYDAGE
jgi:hypothetical protein